MTAALPMGSQKITGMADPTLSTDGATKNYVDTITAAFFSTGDVKLTLKTSADSGWVLFDDGTIGSATSGATSYANALAQPLFNLFFTNMTDANAPILTSGGGATTRAAQVSAANAWAANCRISLPKTLGRALAVGGSGSGLSARALGQTVGEENHALVVAEIPPVTSSSGSAVAVSPTGNNNPAGVPPGSAITNLQVSNSGVGSNWVPTVGSAVWGSILNYITNAAVSVTSSSTSGTAHNTMQPTVFLNCMIKL